MSRVESTRNPRVRRARDLARNAGLRRNERACVLEGVRPVREHLERGDSVELALVSDRLAELPDGARVTELLGRLDDGVVHPVSDRVLASVSDTRTPQGVVLIVPTPSAPDLPRAFDETSSTPRPSVLVAWDVGDPGNVGTLLRTAEAAGCPGLVLAAPAGQRAADPFSPRALRASAGRALAWPPVEVTGDASDLRTLLLDAGWRLVACVPRGGTPAEAHDIAHGVALVLGSETRGVPAALASPPTELLTIPLASRSESLNVAAAGAVVTFEAARQRRLAAP